MQVVEINTVSAQAFEARLAGGAQMRWPPVPTPLAGAWPRQAALGRNDQSVGIGRQSFGDQLLADARTVGIGRVDEGDAQSPSSLCGNGPTRQLHSSLIPNSLMIARRARGGSGYWGTPAASKQATDVVGGLSLTAASSVKRRA